MQKARRIAVLKIYGESDRHESGNREEVQSTCSVLKRRSGELFRRKRSRSFYTILPNSRPMAVEVTIVLFVDVFAPFNLRYTDESNESS